MIRIAKPIAISMVSGVLIGLVAIAVAAPFIPRTPVELSSAVVPDKLGDLPQQADIVFVGKVDKILHEGEFSGYSTDGQLLDGVTVDGQPHPNLPYTDFEVKTGRILKGDEFITTGDSVTLRMLGHWSEGSVQISLEREFPSYSDDQNVDHLFLLSSNPDSSYGFYYGPWSRLDIEANRVRIPDRLQEVSAAGEQVASMNIDEFAQLIDSPGESSTIYLPIVQ